MKNTMKKIGLLFSVIIMVMLFTVSVSALDATGKCGDNVYWSYDKNTGELLINGEGEMYDYQTMDWWGGNPSPFEYSNIKTLIIDDNVTYIGNEAFFYCSNLENVIFGKNTIDIGFKTFFNCENLNNLSDTDNIKNIGAYAFNNTAWQKNQSAGVSYIGKVAYMYKGNTEKVVQIKEDTESIAPWAFSACKNIETIIFPDSTTVIGDCAFELCTNLNNLINANNIEYIGTSAFNYTLWLEKQPSGTVYIGKTAYLYKGDTPQNATIEIRNGIKSITNYAFANKNGLENLIIPDSVIYIGNNAFERCTDLKNIVFGKNVKHIGNYAFNYCNSLKSVTIPKSVAYIGYEAFVSESLAEAIILNSTVGIDEYAFGYLSGYTTSLSGEEELPVRFVKFKIVSQKDSAADTYAKENGITFIAIDDRPQPPTPPTKIKSSTQTTKTITLTWDECEGATGYRVYKYNSSSKKYTLVKSIKTNKYKVSDLKAGTSYKFKIRPYTKLDDGTVLWGEDSDVFTTATKPATPTIKITSTTKGKAVVSWNNVSGETGYQLYYSTKKDSGYKKIKSYSANTLKGSKSKLTSGKKYYFKVRAYKKVDGKVIYGSFSSVKSIKIK